MRTAISPGWLAARWPVLAMAGALGLLLLLTSGRYGYHGDELYFWVAGYHLDWSYADQPPLLPLLARLMDTVFPGSLVALRIPAAACAVGSVLFAAAIARQLGGSRRAELLTAAAVTGSPVLATGGHVLATTTVDTFLWIVLSWLLVRWIRSRDDRLLLWSGVVTAVALQAKYLIVFLWLVAGVAALTVGPRDLLRRKLFWVGAAIAAGTSVPAVLWQAAHGWPQLSMGAVLAGQEDPGSGGAAGFLLLLLASAGALGVPLLGYGLWWSLRSAEHRFFGWTFLGLVLVLLVTFGHGYYVTGMFAALWAIGAVRLDSARWMPWVAVPAFLLSLVMVVALLPVRPVESLAGQDSSANPVNVASVGWPEMADSVAAAYRELPSGERARTVILTDHYWSASAIARYGPERGLPPVYSPHRGFWYFGAPPENATSVLYVGQRARLEKYFTTIRQVAVLDNRLDVRTTVQAAPVWLCEARRTSWAVLWPELRFL